MRTHTRFEHTFGVQACTPPHLEKGDGGGRKPTCSRTPQPLQALLSVRRILCARSGSTRQGTGQRAAGSGQRVSPEDLGQASSTRSRPMQPRIMMPHSAGKCGAAQPPSPGRWPCAGGSNAPGPASSAPHHTKSRLWLSNSSSVCDCSARVLNGTRSGNSRAGAAARAGSLPGVAGHTMSRLGCITRTQASTPPRTNTPWKNATASSCCPDQPMAIHTATAHTHGAAGERGAEVHAGKEGSLAGR